MNKLQIILIITIIGFLLIIKYSNTDQEKRILFGDYEYCLLITPDTIKDNDVNFNRITLYKDSLEAMNSYYKDLKHSLKIKDTKNAYRIDLSHSSFFQFFLLLDVCAQNNVKQIILNENRMCAYLFPDCKIRSDKSMFVACFYTINSNTIDYKLPERE